MPPKEDRGLAGGAHHRSAMVLCLLLDVMTNRFALGSAHGKRTITFLPGETAQTDLIVHPAGRNGLELSKYIS